MVLSWLGNLISKLLPSTEGFDRIEREDIEGAACLAQNMQSAVEEKQQKMSTLAFARCGQSD